MSDKVNKFKVGDRVKRIANEFPEILIGSEWVVREVLEGSNAIAVEGLSDYWTSDNFKLVLENGQDVKTYDHLKVNKFKVGDEVTFINYEDGNRWEKDFGLFIGDVVQIISNHVDDRVVVVSKTGMHVWCFTDQLSSGSDESSKETQTYNPLNAQEGGGHYKNRGIQPLEYTMKNNLSFCEGNVVKYISRYKDKNGIEDLAKVIHYALLASYEQYGEQGSTELKEKVLKLLGEHG